MDGVKTIEAWTALPSDLVKNGLMDEARLNAATPAAIARRLVTARLSSGKSQAEYARSAGISPTAFNNYENGYRIGIDAAMALCARYELSLDWIYFGRKEGLAPDVRERLANATEAPPKRPRTPRLVHPRRRSA